MSSYKSVEISFSDGESEHWIYKKEEDVDCIYLTFSHTPASRCNLIIDYEKNLTDKKKIIPYIEFQREGK